MGKKRKRKKNWLCAKAACHWLLGIPASLFDCLPHQLLLSGYSHLQSPLPQLLSQHQLDISPSPPLIPFSRTLNHCQTRLNSFEQFFKHFRHPGPCLAFLLLPAWCHLLLLQSLYLVLLPLLEVTLATPQPKTLLQTLLRFYCSRLTLIKSLKFLRGRCLVLLKHLSALKPPNWTKF